jgi:hypothetical protein
VRFMGEKASFWAVRDRNDRAFLRGDMMGGGTLGGSLRAWGGRALGWGSGTEPDRASDGGRGALGPSSTAERLANADCKVAVSGWARLIAG